MREEGCTYRQIADQLGYTKKQIVELEMKVELLKNFLSECGRM